MDQSWTDPLLELLWVKVARNCDVTFVGALYHPLALLHKRCDLLDVEIAILLSILHEFPDALVALTGDLNTLPNSKLIAHTGPLPIVFQPTRGNNLDRIYVSDQQYTSVKVMKSDSDRGIRRRIGAISGLDETGRYVY